MTPLALNLDRFFNRLNEISQIGRQANGGVTRLALTSEDKKARDLLLSWMQKLHLEVQVDDMGNMFGLWRGEQRDHIVGVGSHLDTVPSGGFYDGPLGVLAALEICELMIERGIPPRKTLAVCNFTNEEGVRFFPDMMGSLATVRPDQVPSLHNTKAIDGKLLKDELRSIGYLGATPCGSLLFDRFIELHIEQGPVLENEGKDIGVVTGVQGIKWMKLVVEGKSSHAGTTPLSYRRDTFFAVSALSQYCRELCDTVDQQLVTIGSVKVFPDAINVIPGRTEVALDIRNPDPDRLQYTLAQIADFVNSHASFNGLTTTVTVLADVAPVKFDQAIQNAMIESCQRRNFSFTTMHSGAGHDAQLLSEKYKSGMVFIPSQNGISHSPEEFSTRSQIEKGLHVLTDVVNHFLFS